ncbi:glutaredoxin family protein [Arsukibacterium indicum]|uniref:Glutathione S-transferase N-terminal domain-containing protein n=1 Tax=Arsukibacterium indicum TaxID=2848612 RepID=A0ABS6MK86_9GAMM|nr:glutathione S-transferase N-terminal domain-containing protein [Arsukibacterium indicum]MBV2128711.1 glutathione S-transferase N-terminal domain-containing protein [Arsukibacterium indicum]
MRVLIRLFFRLVRLILTPFMLLAEWLTTPKAPERSAQQQAEVDAACQQLALYQFSACPFCIKVRKEIARLGLNIEKRNAQHNAAHRNELQTKGGRVKVPCLRISAPALQNEPEAEQNEQWLYESDDIIGYLRQQFTPDTTS